jgi:hypothetical protein
MEKDKWIQYRTYILIGKRRYEIQEQKDVPVWYTGIYRLN